MNLTAAWNADYIDAQYERWKTDPHSLSREWRFFFEGFDLAASGIKPPAEAADLHQLLLLMKISCGGRPGFRPSFIATVISVI